MNNSLMRKVYSLFYGRKNAVRPFGGYVNSRRGGAYPL